MSKSLRSMSRDDRAEAISRRLRDHTGGLGYWAAIDANEIINPGVKAQTLTRYFDRDQNDARKDLLVYAILGSFFKKG